MTEEEIPFYNIYEDGDEVFWFYCDGESNLFINFDWINIDSGKVKITFEDAMMVLMDNSYYQRLQRHHVTIFKSKNEAINALIEHLTGLMDERL